MALTITTILVAFAGVLLICSWKGHSAAVLDPKTGTGFRVDAQSQEVGASVVHPMRTHGAFSSSQRRIPLPG